MAKVQLSAGKSAGVPEKVPESAGKSAGGGQVPEKVPEVGLEPKLPGGKRILSPLRPHTRADTEGQEETNYAFIED
jgi:hypothetical protein